MRLIVLSTSLPFFHYHLCHGFTSRTFSPTSPPSLSTKRLLNHGSLSSETTSILVNEDASTSLHCDGGDIDPIMNYNFRNLNGDSISSILICGDGDFSFSLSLAQCAVATQKDTDESSISLTCTVLEDKETHEEIYKNSISNTQNILSYNNKNKQYNAVYYGIDATKLSKYFPSQKFDRIQFNFPHWKGKTNHKENRRLISNFLQSAKDHLSSQSNNSSNCGEIHVALCQGQGGFNSSTYTEWKSSWKIMEYASLHGLLLRDVIRPFNQFYNKSSHRGKDRPFRIGNSPELYIFTLPQSHHNKSTTTSSRGRIPLEYQLACRHELHLVCSTDKDKKENDSVILSDAERKSIIFDRIQSILPKGIRLEIPSSNEEEKIFVGDEQLIVYTIVYVGESMPITRDSANQFRQMTEETIAQLLLSDETEKQKKDLGLLSLRQNRLGRPVSKPFPYTLLKSFLKNS